MKELVVSIKDLKHNINQVKKYVNNISPDTNCTIIAIVKGNGYGLDLIKYSKILVENGIQYLAVATLDEALILRKENITKNILMLSVINNEKELEEAVKNEITITTDSKENVQMINKLANKGYNIKVHIKIDTGFGRYGFIYNNYEDIINCIKSLKKNKVEIEGIFSHFSIAYYKNNKHTKKQFDRFKKVLDVLRENNIDIKLKHICNSPGILNYPNMHLTAVRIGSAFVGRVATKNNIDLRKIGKLRVEVAEVKQVPANFNISYLNAYKTNKKSKIAILPVGYKDGYNVSQRNDMFMLVNKIRRIIIAIKSLFKKEKLIVVINGKIYDIIGTVGMYHVIVDVTEDSIKNGDIAEMEINPVYIDREINRKYII